MSNSRGAKRGHEEEHEEHVNHEAWVIPYADVLTLLMALFLVLWALGSPDEEKTEIAADSFRRELGGSGGISQFDLGLGTGGGPLATGGVSVLEGAGPAPMAGEDDDQVAAAEGEEPRDFEILDEFLFDVEADDPIDLESTYFEPIDRSEEVLGDPLSEVEQVVRDTAVGSGLNTAVGFRRESRGLVVSIVTDRVLFDEGQAEVQQAGLPILDVIADSLADLPNTIIIEGHTDSRPIATARYPSNWELSTARATSVLRYLVEERGFPADRIAAAGYADTHPVQQGDDPAALAANRRVEIVVMATA